MHGHEDQEVFHMPGKKQSPQMRLEPKIEIPKYDAVCITPTTVPILFPCPSPETECFPLHSDLHNQAHPQLMTPTSHSPLIRVLDCVERHGLRFAKFILHKFTADL